MFYKEGKYLIIRFLILILYALSIFQDIKKLIQTSINDKESYLYFGLPANVERSWKQVSASNVVRSLRGIL